MKEEMWQAYQAGASRAGTREDFEEWYKTTTSSDLIWELDLPVRMINALNRHGVTTIGGARQWLEFDAHPDPRYRGQIAAYDMRNIGYKTVEDSRDALRRYDEA